MKGARICLVIYINMLGGSIKVARAVYDALVDEGFEVSVLSVLKSDQEGFFDDVEMTNLNLETSGFLRNSFLEFKKFFAKNKFDLIISFAGFGAYPLAFAKANSKLIISEHGNHTNHKNLLSKTLVNLAYKKADFITFLTKFDYDFYALKHSAIIKNPFFMASDGDEKITKENIILFPSNLSSNKRLEFLINAFALIPPSRRNGYKIVVCGAGDIRKYQNLADEKSVSIEFAGAVKDIENFYQRAKIVALTSLSEGLSNILIEAIFFDCARISVDCICGPSELIKDGFDGFLCGLNDETEFAKKLEILINDEKKAQEFIINARARKDEFKLENFRRSWLKIVNDVLKQ
ncbi:glycosyltransferase [Campylobacter sp. RM16188]|uniref:glycosyltransferase n=1 Tax=Campylobacter sp. RM16188 TaxID=1705725 RepID=UPI001554DCED|nr:glycosyltransferase [Campylobacter sp. RM16188]